MSKFEICPGRFIGVNCPCFITAEVGQNHQGDVNIAKQMIKAAKDCGADCVKFQKSDLKTKFNRTALDRPYHSQHSWGATYGEHKSHLEFDADTYMELQRYAVEEVGIWFTASAMDINSLDFLLALDVPYLKIGSGETNNFALIQRAAASQKPLVISTGLQDMDTLHEVYQLVTSVNDRVCFLQCTSSYPTEPDDVNLRVIDTFRHEFPKVVPGYSGHEIGISITLAAVAKGAKVIERHLTLNKSWKGSDHCCSLEPSEFSQLVREVRIIERALGNPVKQMLPCEHPCYNKLGKTVVAKHNIKPGRVLEMDDLTVKVAEPKGWRAEKIQELVGKKVKQFIKEDESILEIFIQSDTEKLHLQK